MFHLQKLTVVVSLSDLLITHQSFLPLLDDIVCHLMHVFAESLELPSLR